MGYVWECEEKEAFDVMISYVLSQGTVTPYLANHVKFFRGKKSCICVRHLWFVQKLMC